MSDCRRICVCGRERGKEPIIITITTCKKKHGIKTEGGSVCISPPTSDQEHEDDEGTSADTTEETGKITDKSTTQLTQTSQLVESEPVNRQMSTDVKDEEQTVADDTTETETKSNDQSVSGESETNTEETAQLIESRPIIQPADEVIRSSNPSEELQPTDIKSVGPVNQLSAVQSEMDIEEQTDQEEPETEPEVKPNNIEQLEEDEKQIIIETDKDEIRADEGEKPTVDEETPSKTLEEIEDEKSGDGDIKKEPYYILEQSLKETGVSETKTDEQPGIGSIETTGIEPDEQPRDELITQTENQSNKQSDNTLASENDLKQDAVISGATKLKEDEEISKLESKQRGSTIASFKQLYDNRVTSSHDSGQLIIESSKEADVDNSVKQPKSDKLLDNIENPDNDIDEQSKSKTNILMSDHGSRIRTASDEGDNSPKRSEIQSETENIEPVVQVKSATNSNIENNNVKQPENDQVAASINISDDIQIQNGKISVQSGIGSVKQQDTIIAEQAEESSSQRMNTEIGSAEINQKSEPENENIEQFPVESIEQPEKLNDESVQYLKEEIESVNEPKSSLKLDSGIEKNTEIEVAEGKSETLSNEYKDQSKIEISETSATVENEVKKQVASGQESEDEGTQAFSTEINKTDDNTENDEAEQSASDRQSETERIEPSIETDTVEPTESLNLQKSEESKKDQTSQVENVYLFDTEMNNSDDHAKDKEAEQPVTDQPLETEEIEPSIETDSVEPTESLNLKKSEESQKDQTSQVDNVYLFDTEMSNSDDHAKDEEAEQPVTDQPEVEMTKPLSATDNVERTGSVDVKKPDQSENEQQTEIETTQQEIKQSESLQTDQEAEVRQEPMETENVDRLDSGSIEEKSTFISQPEHGRSNEDVDAVDDKSVKNGEEINSASVESPGNRNLDESANMADGDEISVRTKQESQAIQHTANSKDDSNVRKSASDTSRHESYDTINKSSPTVMMLTETAVNTVPYFDRLFWGISNPISNSHNDLLMTKDYTAKLVILQKYSTDSRHILKSAKTENVAKIMSHHSSDETVIGKANGQLTRSHISNEDSKPEPNAKYFEDMLKSCETYIKSKEVAQIPNRQEITNSLLDLQKYITIEKDEDACEPASSTAIDEINCESFTKDQCFQVGNSYISNKKNSKWYNVLLICFGLKGSDSLYDIGSFNDDFLVRTKSSYIVTKYMRI